MEVLSSISLSVSENHGERSGMLSKSEQWREPELPSIVVRCASAVASVVSKAIDHEIVLGVQHGIDKALRRDSKSPGRTSIIVAKPCWKSILAS